MATISTFDRFLGSFLGSYMGYHFSDGCPSGNTASIYDSQLYQSWMLCVPGLTFPDVNGSYIQGPENLPWLLYHHDNVRARHDSLAQQLSKSSSVNGADITAHSIGTLYILGDTLEWLMQDASTPQEPLPSLCSHLKHQQPSYPAIIHAPVTQLMTEISTFSGDQAQSSPFPDKPYAELAAAIVEGLNHRENLALALSSSKESPLTLTAIGCLLGAWGGLTVIPKPWIRLLAPASRRIIIQVAEDVYRQWAGIGADASTFEVLPLDL